MRGRGARVEDLIKQELARILQRDMKDPRVGLATISHLEVSADLAHAQVKVSVLGDDDDVRQESVRTLQQARGFIRSQLARNVRLRRVPELLFELDRGAEHSQKISDLLESLHGDTKGS